MRVLRFLGVSLVAFVWLPGPRSTAALGAGVPTELEVLPAKAMLFGPQAAQRLVVIGAFPDGSRLDLTASAQFEVGGSQDRLGRSPRFSPPGRGRQG